MKPVAHSYLVGSLRLDRVRLIAAALREDGHIVFDDWHASGPEADDIWKAYEQQRGRTYLQALKSPFAMNAFAFDKRHIQEADTVVLVLPAGKSGHLELGYAVGLGKRGFILLDNTDDRWDLMYQFASGIFDSLDALKEAI